MAAPCRRSPSSTTMPSSPPSRRPRRSSGSASAFLRFHAGEWVMPAKVYLDSPPYGDFRAMPARGDGLALLKWITSFPGNPAHGLPTVTGVICLSDASTGEPLMLLDARSVTALRTGAVAAVAARALALPGRDHGGDRRLRAARRVDRPLPGRRRLRARASATTRDPAAAQAWLQSSAGAPDRASRRSAATSSAASRPAPRSSSTTAICGRACTSTCSGPTDPARPRRALGAVASCALFCDEWTQASHGGELTGAVAAGLVDPRAGHRARRGPRRRGAGAPGTRSGHPVRLDRAGDPGPRDRRRRAGGMARRRVEAQTVTL